MIYLKIQNITETINNEFSNFKAMIKLHMKPFTVKWPEYATSEFPRALTDMHRL